MKRLLHTIIILLLFISAAWAEDEKGPMITIGITGMWGANTLKTDMEDIETDTGYIYGGGLLLEKMMFRHLGINTGVQYRSFKNDFEMTDTSAAIIEIVKVHWKFNAISVPFHFVTSIQGPSSSLNILLGSTYTHIYSAEMSTSSIGLAVQKEDATKYINPNQIAVSGGLIFRFLITDYTDFFMGVMAEYYPMNLLDTPGDENDKIRMLNYSFNTGYMFRTDLF